MTETKTDDMSSQEEDGGIPEADDLVRSMGLVFNNTFLYGSAHGVTKKAVEESFGFLTRILEQCEEIVFNTTDDGLLVNGRQIELKNPLMHTFLTHLAELEISSFSLTRGMSEIKFNDLIEVLNAKPEELQKLGGFAEVVATVGLENVRASKVVYKRISEDELVTSKEEFVNTAVQKAGGMAGMKETQEGESKGISEAKGTEGVNVGGILAFLKGDVSGQETSVAKDIQDVASDSNKLADLILHAAVVRQESPDIEGGESFGNLVVGCLRRAYDGLSKSPSIKTQKGKKTLTKSLMLLEKDVLDKMREMAGEVTTKDEEAVSDVIEELATELKIDSLAAEYMKKRNAVDTSEERLLRFIKTKGADQIGNTALEEKLSEGGLTPDGWQELLIKSGTGPGMGEVGVGAGGAGMEAMGNLALLLTKIEEAAKESGDTDAEALTEAVKEASREVDTIVAGTEQKIDTLVETIKADEKVVEDAEKKAKKEGKGPVLTRKALLELLAEIVQELCQPIAVINCSTEMIRSKNLGDITDLQKDMLDLVCTSGEKLKQLTDRLLEISGLPSTMSPDEEIQTSLYK